MNTFISAGEYERAMKELAGDNAYMTNGVNTEYDSETFHKQADELMCKVLRGLGYSAGCDIYEKIPKHYSKEV